MSVRRGSSLTISFAAIDSELRPQRKSGLSWASGDVKLSKDGGTVTDTDNLPVEIGSTGRYALSLTSAEMDAAWIHVMIDKDTIDPIDMLIGTAGNPSGTVVTDGGNSTTAFRTDLSESTDDHWRDCLLLMTSGSLLGQVKKVTAYSGSTHIITLGSALTATPSVGDRFILVNL